MNSKVIKIVVVIIAILFVLVLSNAIRMNAQDEKLLDLQLKISQNFSLSKDLNLELNKIYQSSYINYDSLNYAKKEFLSNIINLRQMYPVNREFTKIHNIIIKQDEHIDLTKRANSLIENSFLYIKYLPNKTFLNKGITTTKNIKQLRNISRKLIDATHEVKLLNRLNLNSYDFYIKELKSIKTGQEILHKYQTKMIMHLEMIRKNALIMQKNIEGYNTLQHELKKAYIQNKESIKNKHLQIRKKIKYSQTIIILSLISLIILIHLLLVSEGEYIKEQKRLQEIIDKNIISSTTDLEGIITSASEAYCNISGYTREELVDQPHSIIRHPDMPEKAFKDMWDTIKAGKVWKGNVKNLKKNGDYYWVYAVIEPIFNSSGDIDSYFAIRVDITDKISLGELTEVQEEKINLAVSDIKSQKNKLSKALKAKSEFLANMSHEIRTPLNAIVGFVDILSEKIKDKENKEYLDIINNSSHHLLGIINDILDFSKLESGKLNIDKVDFSPKDEFNNTINLFAAKASAKNISLKIIVDDKLPKIIKTDPLRVKQVVSNLLSNAIKFTQESGNIIVKIGYRKNSLYLSVKDDGKGISKNKLSHIFNAFSQEDSSTTREYGGTGLGLSISNELVKVLGGELKVKSEIDKGSEFYFTIPAVVGEDVIQMTDKKKNITFENKKVLLVEDNTANQMFMKVIFKKLKLAFDVANDGVEAVEIFQKNRYDIILMDENMPNKNGIQATKEILEYEKENNLSHTPIIALTANALKGDREKFLNAGMDEYLSKPVDKNRLALVLEEFLGC